MAAEDSSKIEEPVVEDAGLERGFTRARADTCDATLTVTRDADRLVVIDDAIAYTSRSTGHVSAEALAKAWQDESKAPVAKSDGAVVYPSTYLMRFTLAPSTWRGERSLFCRGGSGIEAPAVTVVGPYNTLRFRVASSGGKASAGAGLLGRGRKTKANETVLNSSPEAPLKPDVSYHLAIVLTAEEIRYFIDGALIRATALHKGSLAAGLTGGLTVGRSRSCDGVPCTVDRLHVVCRAMTDEEVAADFADASE